VHAAAGGVKRVSAQAQVLAARDVVVLVMILMLLNCCLTWLFVSFKFGMSHVRSSWALVLGHVSLVF
jgi:hypothetical protein